MAEFGIVKTSQSTTREGMVFAGGNLGKKVTINYGAVLVRHRGDAFLFDSGLGLTIDAQYGADMPGWKRPLLWYGPVDAARTQLERAGIATPQRIILSHGHWDHASGLVDFPGAEVWTTPAERAFLRHGHDCGWLKRGGVMPSQVEPTTIRWHEFEPNGPAYGGFERSYDLYGDGAIVFAAMEGHTPGSIGMFVTVESGRRFLFCGDTVWSASAIPNARPKMLLARALADDDPAQTLRQICRLRDLAGSDSQLTIVPAHDGALQDRLGYFPSFIR